jgi:GntR family transcriptional regulator/MocR family aminotransferase
MARLRRGGGALLSLALRRGHDQPLHRQVCERVRAAILSGALRPGARLPSTRSLAADLRVSRSTVVHAYGQLRSEGYVETLDRGTTRVSAFLPEASTRPAAAGTAARAGPVAAVSRRGARLASFWPQFPPIAERPARPFRTSVPALDVFPLELWARLTARCVRRSTPASLAYGDPRGLLALRQAIADYLVSGRGLRCDAGQVLVTSGSQQALDLASRVLLDPGDLAWIEDPGYFGAGAALVASGARLVPVPVDSHGIDVAEGRRRAPDARLAFVTPARQLPLGMAMSAARRRELLAWAAERRAFVIEDDYASEFRYASRPLPALLSEDRHGCVVLVGTFSKLMFPALRLGYLVAPAALVESLAAARRFLDFCPPQLAQAVMAAFLAEGHFERHVRRMRTIYASRRQLLVDLLERELGGRVEVDAPDSGMNLVAWLPPGSSDVELSRALEGVGVDAVPVSACALEASLRPGLILGFSGTGEAELREGVARLGRVLGS